MKMEEIFIINNTNVAINNAGFNKAVALFKKNRRLTYFNLN